MKIYRLLFVFFIVVCCISCTALKREPISEMSDTKLISAIGRGAHTFLKPQYSGNRNPLRLEPFLREAEKRGLSFSENVKWARKVLGWQKNNLNMNLNTKTDNFPEAASSLSFIRLAKKRQSIRSFLDKQIPDEIVKKILEAAIEAPSSCNRQTWRFLVIKDLKSKNFIANWRYEEFLRAAPVVVCVFVDTEAYILPEDEQSQWMDGSAAIMTIIYAAESLGLNSCWVDCVHGPRKTKELLNYFKLDEKLMPISFVVLGYGNQHIDKPAREKTEYYLLNK